MSSDINKLVMFGGEPAFSEMLHVGKPNVGDRIKLFERFEDIIDSRWFTNDGPYVRQFERKVADFCRVKNCISVCNGTLGLELVIKAMGLSGEVILPSFTFAATAHVLQWCGITPVFCDIDPATHNIDPAQAESLITAKTTAIIGVHLWGRPCDVDSLEVITEKYGIKLFFDAAHAFGCSLGERFVGGFGEAEVVSFHATKYINAFEGGAILTDNDELAEELRLMRNFGFAGYDNVVCTGTNAKMSEISAAMGMTSLESVDNLMALNKTNYERYFSGLQDVCGVALLEFDKNNSYNYQYIVLEIDKDVYGISRDLLMKILHAENIFARRYFYPSCHRMEPYKTLFPDIGSRLPETEKLADKVLVLPTGSSVSGDDIDKICNIITMVAEHREAISNMDKQDGQNVACKGERPFIRTGDLEIWAENILPVREL
jgi:dTDP-4-amino-4,6-dideoxygalactose transaminase